MAGHERGVSKRWRRHRAGPRGRDGGEHPLHTGAGLGGLPGERIAMGSRGPGASRAGPGPRGVRGRLARRGAHLDRRLGQDVERPRRQVVPVAPDGPGHGHVRLRPHRRATGHRALIAPQVDGTAQLRPRLGALAGRSPRPHARKPLRTPDRTVLGRSPWGTGSRGEAPPCRRVRGLPGSGRLRGPTGTMLAPHRRRHVPLTGPFRRRRTFGSTGRRLCDVFQKRDGRSGVPASSPQRSRAPRRVGSVGRH
jgi:hypothetical protein